MAAGMRASANLSVDVLVRRAREPVQRVLAMIACACCLAYAGLFLIASIQWVSAVLTAGIGAADLDRYGIKNGHIPPIVPFRFALVTARYLQILSQLGRALLRVSV